MLFNRNSSGVQLRELFSARHSASGQVNSFHSYGMSGIAFTQATTLP
jgi:hypothetical protein